MKSAPRHESSLDEDPPTGSTTTIDHRYSLELSAEIDALRRLDYTSRKIKIELCVLAPRATARDGVLDRGTYNLLLAFRPICDSINTADGDATVRLERYQEGVGADVTDVMPEPCEPGIDVCVKPQPLLSLTSADACQYPTFLSKGKGVPAATVAAWNSDKHHSRPSVGLATRPRKRRAGSTLSSAGTLKDASASITVNAVVADTAQFLI